MFLHIVQLLSQANSLSVTLTSVNTTIVLACTCTCNCWISWCLPPSSWLASESTCASECRWCDHPRIDSSTWWIACVCCGLALGWFHQRRSWLPPLEHSNQLSTGWAHCHNSWDDTLAPCLHTWTSCFGWSNRSCGWLWSASNRLSSCDDCSVLCMNVQLSNVNQFVLNKQIRFLCRRRGVNSCVINSAGNTPWFCWWLITSSSYTHVSSYIHHVTSWHVCIVWAK